MTETHRVSATALRQNIYQLLDDVLETGAPLEVERGGRRLRIIRVETTSKLDRLIRRDIVTGDPEDLVHMDWSTEWRPYLGDEDGQ